MGPRRGYVWMDVPGDPVDIKPLTLPLFSGTQTGGAGGGRVPGLWGSGSPGALIAEPLPHVTVDKVQRAAWTVLPYGAFLLVGKTENTMQ